MSIELTEEIRNFEFTSSMDFEIRKHYVEQLAFAVLRYCYNEYDSLILSDSPDLQSSDRSLGIEVTEVAINKIKSIEGDFEKYRKKGKAHYLKQIENKGGLATEFSYTTPGITKQDELDAMKKIFQKKINKIPSYKQKGYIKLGLIMVMDEMPIPNTVLEWREHIYKIYSKAEYKYDIIFFTYHYALRVLDLTTGKDSCKKIDETDYDALRKYARLMAENTLSY